MKWGGNIKKDQGQPFEDFVGPRFFPDSVQTPDTLKVYDYVDRVTGASVSVKTLNTLTESRLANPSQLFDTTRGYINKMIDFKEDSKLGFEWTADNVTSRELMLGVPAETTPAQWAEISRAMLYGQQNNVKVTIIKVE